jgi:hypothetical protein
MQKTKLILLAALLCAPVITRAATVIGSLPYTISAPGTYVLSRNLTAKSTDGIDVNASNVTIDLGGYTLTQRVAGNGSGIFVTSGMSNVSVQNGVINGFYDGVFFGTGSGDALINVELLAIGNVGVSVEANDCLIENCVIGGASGASFGIGISNAGAVGVRNNQVSGFTYGIYEWSVTSPNALIGNYEANCTYGLNLSSGSKYQGNVATECSTPVTGGIAVGQENG